MPNLGRHPINRIRIELPELTESSIVIVDMIVVCLTGFGLDAGLRRIIRPASPLRRRS